MKATVPSTTIQRAGVDSIAVGQVTVGPIHIDRLALTNFHMGMSTGQVRLRNFRVSVELSLSLDWWVGVHVPFDGNVGGSGTIDLGSPTITIPLGDVTVPGLQQFSIDLASLNIPNLSAASIPISNLHLGGAVAEQIQAHNLTLPSQGFTIAGLGLGSATIDGVQVPAASGDTVTIGRVHGDLLPLGQFSLSNLALPSASVGDVASGPASASAVGPVYTATADAGILRVTLTVTPHATAAMDELHLSGLQASGSIGNVELTNVVAPYELLNLTLSQIGIETITIPTLAIS